MRNYVMAVCVVAGGVFSAPTADTRILPSPNAEPVRFCGTATPSASASVQAVDAATDDLNAGRNKQAIARLYDRYGKKINGWAFNPRTSNLLQREVVLIVALATLRSEGRIQRSWKGYAEDDPAAVRGNLGWAIRAMEGLAFVGEAPQRHLAEAWARDPQLKSAARTKLQELADEGRLLSPDQYEVLARLHHEAGDSRRARWARERAEEKRLE